MGNGAIQSTPPPARIHLLPAKEAPVVIVIRRKPSKVFHVLRWNIETDEIESGSWFQGRLYEMRSDVSFDGEWMTYLAMGSQGRTWTGVCQPPFLRTAVDWANVGSWHGGGLFAASDLLLANPGYGQSAMERALRERTVELPFRVELLPNPGYGEDEGVLYPRFERDGYRRAGPRGEERVVEGETYTVVCDDDPGWVTQPTPDHPILRIRYRGYQSGHIYEFDLPEFPDLLDPAVSWAAYDALGQLVFARAGILYRYTLEGIRKGGAAASIDLEPLTQPPRESREAIPLRVVEGALQDQPVHHLVLPFADVAWVARVRELAGGGVWPPLQSYDPLKRPCKITSGGDLRQQCIVHVAEPSPDLSLRVLGRVCHATFETLERFAGRRVALRPIGIAAGWPFEVAARVTVEAAKRFVAERLGREIFFVADGPEERAILEERLGARS